MSIAPVVRRYGGAVLIVAVAGIVRWLLQPLLAFNLPFVTFFGAVFLCGWLYGLRPTVLAVLLSAVTANVLFFPPVDAGEHGALLNALGLGLFVAIGIGTGVLGESRLRALQRAQTEADESRQARAAGEEVAVEAEELAAQAEEFATQAEERALRLAAIVDSSDDAIISKDLDGRVQGWNPAAERIFGYTAAEMVGQSVFRLIPPDLHAEEHAILARIRRGEHVAHYETSRLRKDGQRILIALTVSPIRDAGGALVGASAIKRDVTDQRSLEAQLRHAQQLDAIGQLAGGVAHDFNNILTAISGYTALLLRNLPADDHRRPDVMGIQDAADRAVALTQQLLAFGRKQVMQPTVVDLREVLDDTGRMLRRLLGEHIDLAIVPGPIVSPVVADRGQLGQVLVNLAVNARDAMPDGGRLTIGARDTPLTEEYADSHLAVSPGSYVLLAVSDTGRGMTPEVRARIFEPFFTTKPRGKGTGLGLSTVFGIVKQCGGHIFVYSEPGQGTTVKIYLPRAEAAAGAVAPTVEAAPDAQRPGTILLVEDDASIRAVTRRLLETGGYTVLEAATPSKARDFAEHYAGPIHLLLTDVVMPEMSGPQLAALIREQRTDLPVLYMSGYADDAIVHHGRLDPGAEFLPKPFTPESLLRRVQQALGQGGADVTAAGA